MIRRKTRNDLLREFQLVKGLYSSPQNHPRFSRKQNTPLFLIREREKLQKKGEFLATAAVEKERECGLEREAEARAIGVAEAEATAARAREEDRLAAEDSQSVALAEAAAHAEAAALVARSLDQVAKTRAEIEAAAERAKLEKELAKARERAVKLEGGKWQKASEEAEARAAAEQVLWCLYCCRGYEGLPSNLLDSAELMRSVVYHGEKYWCLGIVLGYRW